MACDFCAWGDPIWKYPCKDFQTEEIVVHNTSVSMDSFRHWAACDECSRLIEEEDLHELAQRAFKSSVDNPSRLSANQKGKLMDWVRETHLQFMKNRLGRREPLLPGDEGSAQ